MTTLLLVSNIFAWIVITAWLARHWLIAYVQQNQTVLTSETYDVTLADPPGVSVLVAAKDEEANIENCVRRLLQQRYPDFEIIIINDRSADATPAILQRLAREHGDRLTVIDIESLPTGWFGKSHAMHVGVQRARGDYFLFSDADCSLHSPHCLTIAMQHLRTKHADFVSINPQLDMRSFWEKCVQPVAAIGLIIWFPQNKVNKARSPLAYATGQFMLMKRSCYDAFGGHAAVPTEVNEDIHFARLAKQARQRLKVADNAGLFRSRMYGTLAEAWRGWGRIYFGSLPARWKLVAGLVSMIAFNVLPWIGIVFAVTMALWLHGAGWGYNVLYWLGAAALMHIGAARVYPMFGLSRWDSIGYPIGGAIVAAMHVSALLKAIGATSVSWRGTTYRGNRVVGGPSSDIAAKSQ